LTQARKQHEHLSRANAVQHKEILEISADLYNPLALGANSVMLGSPGTASLATGAVLKEGYLYKVWDERSLAWKPVPPR